MNTINTNPGARSAQTTGVDSPTQAAVELAAQQAVVYQPYVFVDGEPPPDIGVPAAGANTAGLSPPQRASLLPSELNNVSVSLSALIAMSPTSTTDAMTAANTFAMQNLLIRMSLEMRNQSLKDRDNEVQNLIRSRNTAIDKGLEAAKWELAAGVTSGATMAVGGAMAAVGGFKGEGLTGGTIATGKFSGIGTSVQGLGNVASAALTYTSNLTKADQQRAELDAELANNRISQNNERAANALEALRSFVQTQLAILQVTVESVKRVFA